MEFNAWDPLKTSEHLDPEIISASLKRVIKNILKSYVGTFDPFAELIQNALDAVDKRGLIEEESNYKKQIWLFIDLRENSFTIVDNGIGFTEKEFKTFLAPNMSFKEGKNSRGNKGVGATYIAYGFNHLELGTKSPSFNFYGKIEKGNEWVVDNDGLVTRPEIRSTECTNDQFNSLKRGSIFKLTFGGKDTRPKDLSWFQATTAKQWAYLLRLKTPLGGVDLHRNTGPMISFNLSVRNKSGEEFTETNLAKYIYPETEIKASVDLKEILAFQQKQIADGKDASIFPAKFNKLNGIYEYFNSEEIKSLPSKKIEAKEKELIDEFKITAYGYFTYSTAIWDELNDNQAKLRKGFRVLRGGIQLANNFMIQGDMIAIPLTSNIGYQNQSHIIVHFENADPDLGRKGFQPELKELAEIIGVGIVNRLKNWKKQLKNDTGNRPDIAKEMDLNSWIKEQENFIVSNPLKISNPNFFQPINEISILSEPQSEQDVIVLFNQLVAGGVIRGIKLLSTSQYKQYDGLFKFFINPPEDSHIFHKSRNPLGIQYLTIPIGSTTVPKVLEYKFNLDALISEFENGEKNEKEISIAIAWEIGEAWHKHYEIISLLDLDNLQHREFHGITHIFRTATTNFYAIILNELITYLSDVDSVQEYHREKYSDSLFQ